MTDLPALLTRLAADAPDPTLNEDIARALGWRRPHRAKYWTNGGPSTHSPPDFLNSVDMALTTIPDGWDIRARQHRDGLWCVTLAAWNPYLRRVRSWPGPIWCRPHRKPLPVALVIVALKARGKS